MASTAYKCDICFEEETGQPAKECCGLKVCILCDVRTMSLCSVCEKDELNEEIQCDVCGAVGNMFTVTMCAENGRSCDLWVCGQCDKSPEDFVFKCCSVKHFHKYMRSM